MLTLLPWAPLTGASLLSRGLSQQHGGEPSQDRGLTVWILEAAVWELLLCQVLALGT